MVNVDIGKFGDLPRYSVVFQSYLLRCMKAAFEMEEINCELFIPHTLKHTRHVTHGDMLDMFKKKRLELFYSNK